MITSEFMQDVKSQLTFSLIRIKHDSPLMLWDNINGRLIYKGDDTQKLIPIHTRPYMQFKKYCK